MRSLLKRKNLITLGLFALAIIAGTLSLRGPQEKPGTPPGKFDFWVLALSWSPTYCLQEGQDDTTQCGTNARKGFVVHGLWPQYESGYPANCTYGPERIDYRFADEMADLIPSPGLVFHQWRKHGRCTGLSPDAYFEATRQAAKHVEIPGNLLTAPSEKLSPKRIEAGFVTANTGLETSGMAVICNNGLFREVRICLDKAMKFRACAEVDADACRAGTLTIPEAGTQ